MEDPFSNFNLTMLNLWIGMCRGDPALPSHFRDLGYDDHRIEDEVHIIVEEGENERVRPELIITSLQQGHTVLHEWKSGPNTEEDQLRRYSLVRDSDLRDSAYVPTDALESIDISVSGLEDYEERLRLLLDGEDGFQFSLVTVSSDGLRILLDRFDVSAFSDSFYPVLKIDWETVPRHYVPIDDSSSHHEVAREVAPEIVAAMLQRQPRVTTEEIARSICNSTWSSMGRDRKGVIRAKVSEVLSRASSTNFSAYLNREGRDSYRVTNNPLDLSGSARTREYQRLRKKSDKLVESLREGAIQESLFAVEE